MTDVDREILSALSGVLTGAPPARVRVAHVPCGWSGDEPADGRCPRCGDPCPPLLRLGCPDPDYYADEPEWGPDDAPEG